MSDVTMLEIVARALDDAWRKGSRWELTPAALDMLARVALQALRDPTDEMIDALEDELPLVGDASDYDDLRRAWAAAIDAALQPKEPR
jgi:hypothetical protein